MTHDQGAVDPPERTIDMTKFKEHTIWDSQPDYADWQDDLAAEYPDMTEDERFERMLDINADYLDDERANLNIPLGMPILLIADIGRWDGRYSGYGVIRSGNIRDCLRSWTSCGISAAGRRTTTASTTICTACTRRASRRRKWKIWSGKSSAARRRAGTSRA